MTMIPPFVAIRFASRLARFTTLVALLGSVVSAPVSAQETLDQLQRKFMAEARAMGPERPTRAQEEALLTRQIGELETFLRDTAKGDDRWNGRLMLAELNRVRGNREGAAKALASIDVDQAPPLLLVSGAALARHLGQDELLERWLETAMARAGTATLEDQMAMARLFMIVHHAVERGDKILAAALASAKDDEERAMVRWHRADMLRDREDLPENTGFIELEKLAQDLPDTYWGDVAKDRLRATRLAPGAEAIDFKAETLAGRTIELSKLRGKAVILAFWQLRDYDTPNLVRTLNDLAREHGDKLAIVSVCIDQDKAAIEAGVKDLGIAWPVVGDGKGIGTDIALRWFVEGPTLHVIGPDGKIRALGLHAGTRDAREQLSAIIKGSVPN